MWNVEFDIGINKSKNQETKQFDVNVYIAAVEGVVCIWKNYRYKKYHDIVPNY